MVFEIGFFPCEFGPPFSSFSVRYHLSLASALPHRLISLIFVFLFVYRLHRVLPLWLSVGRVVTFTDLYFLSISMTSGVTTRLASKGPVTSTANTSRQKVPTVATIKASHRSYLAGRPQKRGSFLPRKRRWGPEGKGEKQEKGERGM